MYQPLSFGRKGVGNGAGWGRLTPAAVWEPREQNLSGLAAGLCVLGGATLAASLGLGSSVSPAVTGGGEQLSQDTTSISQSPQHKGPETNQSLTKPDPPQHTHTTLSSSVCRWKVLRFYLWNILEFSHSPSLEFCLLAPLPLPAFSCREGF